MCVYVCVVFCVFFLCVRVRMCKVAGAGLIIKVDVNSLSLYS